MALPVEPRNFNRGWGDNSENVGADLLSWLYEFRDAPGITSFLDQNQTLVPLLLAVYGQVCLRFGSESRLALELFTDPEGDSDRTLIVVVRGHFTPEKARKALDDFDMEWWLDVLPCARHKLTVVVEYI